MKGTDVILLVAIVVAGILVWCFVLRLPPCSPGAEPIVEDAYVGKVGLSPLLEQPRAVPRPLIEYLNAVLSVSLIEPRIDASRVLPRPLVQYSESAFNIVLQEPPTSPMILPRPLIEYSSRATVFTLEQLADLSFACVQPRPSVEYADAGWSQGLSPPSQLLEQEEG